MKSGFSKPIVSLQHKKQQLTSSRHRRQQQHNFQHEAYLSSSSKLLQQRRSETPFKIRRHWKVSYCASIVSLHVSVLIYLVNSTEAKAIAMTTIEPTGL